MGKKMLIGLVCTLLGITAICHAVLVNGYCYLENQTNHEGTKVLFQADSPGAVTDSTYTDLTGHYQIDLVAGTYDVAFIHEGFVNGALYDQLLFSPTTLPDISLIEIPPGVYISGALSGVLEDTTYLVESSISVASGDTLIIEPGAIFYFLGGSTFTINGYLYAAGAESDSIKFMPFPEITLWGGINFNGASDQCLLEFCLITRSNSSGIYCINSNPTINNCTVSENSASYGGGIYCAYPSNPSINYCTINGNSASNGGGIYCANFCSPPITYCTISGNSASYGGGIYCESVCSSIITHCTINGNQANYSGGGIHCYNSSNPTINHCNISENSA
ncbi:MAG: right-handed parallel beta-helix repeat-containing protein, partial [bacterium]